MILLKSRGGYMIAALLIHLLPDVARLGECLALKSADYEMFLPLLSQWYYCSIV